MSVAHWATNACSDENRTGKRAVRLGKQKGDATSVTTVSMHVRIAHAARTALRSNWRHVCAGAWDRCLQRLSLSCAAGDFGAPPVAPGHQSQVAAVRAVRVSATPHPQCRVCLYPAAFAPRLWGTVVRFVCCALLAALLCRTGKLPSLPQPDRASPPLSPHVRMSAHGMSTRSPSPSQEQARRKCTPTQTQSAVHQVPLLRGARPVRSTACNTTRPYAARPPRPRPCARPRARVPGARRRTVGEPCRAAA